MSKIKEYVEDAKELGLIPKPDRVYIVSVFDLTYKKYIASKAFINKDKAYEYYYKYVQSVSENINKVEDTFNKETCLIYHNEEPVYHVNLDEIDLID